MSGPDSHQLGPIAEVTPEQRADLLRLLERHDAMDLAGMLLDPPRDTRTCGRGHVFPAAVVSRSCPTCSQLRSKRKEAA